MSRFLTMNPELHIIMGCMYSGKSTELLKIINHYKILEKSVCVINHKLDQRYGEDQIVSHDQKSHPCVSVSKLEEVVNLSVFKESNVIVIEEAQFFENLYKFVVERCIDTLGKTVYVAGLDGDSFQKPFGEILSLIPYSDSVTKLSALCVKCKDGTKANFSKRIVSNTDQKLIGSFESFIPVCRYHLKN